MNRRRVTVSPSNAPGIPRSAVYLDFGVLRGSGTSRDFRSGRGWRTIPPGCARRSLLGAAPRRLRGLVVRCGTTADRGRARVPHRGGPLRVALRVGLRTQRDHVGELDHRVEVTQCGEPLEAERVQAVAGQQREVAGRRRAPRGPRRSAGGSPRGSPRPAARSPGRPRRRAAVGASESATIGGQQPAVSSREPSRASVRSQARSPSIARLSVERRVRGLDRLRHVVGACAPATGTRPRTATAAGTRRAPAAPGTRRRRPRCRRPRRPRSRARAPRRRTRSAGPVVCETCTGRDARRLAQALGQRVRRVRQRRGRRPRSSSSSAARPAATASGFPLSVPAW